MSIKIMSAVWENGPRGSAETMVLVALADYCNDDGECWPSVAAIARKARMTDRGVQKICARLCEIGWLQIDQSAGRRGCNLYRITPERGSPPNVVHPEHRSPPPRTPFTPTPEPRSPEPSFNHQEPSGDILPPKAKRQSPDMELPEGWVPSDKNTADAEAKGFTITEINHHAEQFRNYHHAKGSRFRNWDAAWRTWLGNARKFNTSQPPRGSGAGFGTVDAFRAAAARYETGQG